MKRAKLGPAALAMLALGCGGQSSRSSSNGGSADAAASNDQGPPYGATVDGAAIPSTFSATTVQAAAAACNAPHGDVYTPTTTTEVASHLIGAWYMCEMSGPDAGNPMGGETMTSMVLRPDGSFRYLVPYADGGLEEGTGLVNEGSWQIETYCTVGGEGTNGSCPAGSGGTESFNLYVGVNGAEAGGMPFFEEGPLRLELQSDYLPGNWVGWFVPLAQ